MIILNSICYNRIFLWHCNLDYAINTIVLEQMEIIKWYLATDFLSHSFANWRREGKNHHLQPTRNTIPSSKLKRWQCDTEYKCLHLNALRLSAGKENIKMQLHKVSHDVTEQGCENRWCARHLQQARLLLHGRQPGPHACQALRQCMDTRHMFYKIPAEVFLTVKITLFMYTHKITGSYSAS